jgi:hypothetical protein
MEKEFQEFFDEKPTKIEYDEDGVVKFKVVNWEKIKGQYGPQIMLKVVDLRTEASGVYYVSSSQLLTQLAIENQMKRGDKFQIERVGKGKTTRYTVTKLK